MSRGRKVQRHACSVIGTQQYGRMENSSTSASPAKGSESVGAAGKAEKRETNASEPLMAPEAAGRRETKEPCSVETAKSTGTRGGQCEFTVYTLATSAGVQAEKKDLRSQHS